MNSRRWLLDLGDPINGIEVHGMRGSTGIEATSRVGLDGKDSYRRKREVRSDSLQGDELVVLRSEVISSSYTYNPPKKILSM